MVVNFKQWYVSFLEKDKKNALEQIFYSILCFLSVIYKSVVITRNFFYDKQILKSYHPKSKVISIGNISWAGSGKTSLSLWLYEKLAPSHKTAILRRGYGSDEGKLISETTKDVFSSIDRVSLIKDLQSSFDVFILDDGFQYRKLKPNVNIVIMGAREFKRKHRLIPAYFFREPLESLKRADILLLNYKEEFDDMVKVKASIRNFAPNLKIYTCSYKPSKFLDLDGREMPFESLATRRFAAFAAIGYPKGFFNKLKEAGLTPSEEIIYPDHHELTEKELKSLEEDLFSKGIGDLVITSKDKYHLPMYQTKLNIVVMNVEVKIDDEDIFLINVRQTLA